jgi:hypothetical protein
LVTDFAPSSVAAGGGVFNDHVVVQMYFSIGCRCVGGKRLCSRSENWCHHPEKKNPACFSGEQGSRKSMIYGQILNYLLASLVLSSLAELGRVLIASTPSPQPGLPIRGNIPAQRNQAVACE